MTFQELASITGKTVKSVQQAFYRKRFSIRKSADVQAYLHLTLRKNEIRKKRPYQSGDHLKPFRYRAERRSGPEVAAWLAHPRRVGQVGLSSTQQKLLFTLVQSIFMTSPKVLGVVCTGDWLRGGEGLYFLTVFASGARSTPGERARYAVSQMAENSGQDMRLLPVDVAALPSTVAGNDTLNVQLTTGRMEYGWVGMPL